MPPTLHALVAARLDRLSAADRSILQDAAVLGQTFTVEALAAISGETADALEPRLDTLVRQEVLTVETDPRAPTRGQHAFVQALVREVAYGTLSKRDRRARHLTAARHLESLGDEELAGVVASHFVAAYRAAPDGPAGEAVAAQARVSLLATADRAEALGALGQAIDALTSALEVTRDPSDHARLEERIGTLQGYRSRYDEGHRSLAAAVEAYTALGDEVGVIRAVGRHIQLYLASAQIATAMEVARPFRRGRGGARDEGPQRTGRGRIGCRRCGRGGGPLHRGPRTDGVPQPGDGRGSPLVRPGARTRRTTPPRRDRRDVPRHEGDPR